MAKLSNVINLDANATPVESLSRQDDDEGFTYDYEPESMALVPASDIPGLPATMVHTTHADDEVTAALLQPLDRSQVKQRAGFGGNMLDYLEWTTVVTNLNRIFGFGHWHTRVVSITDLGSGENGMPLAVRATLSLTVTFPDGHAAMYENTGFGELRRANNWGAYEMALKGAVSDALKRCAVNLGNQFGLSLYGEATPSSDVAPAPRAPQQSQATVTPVPVNGQTTGGAVASAACDVCGKPIRGYTSSRGTAYTTEQMVNFSKRDCDGRVLCYEHKQQYKLEHGK